MKRLFTILLCSLCFSISYASNKDAVKLEPVGTDPSQPRSVVQKPTATIDTETFTLSVTFLAPGDSYTLSVEDSYGRVVYQAPLSAIGAEETHLLGDLEAGDYTLRIESAKRAFEGDFEI